VIPHGDIADFLRRYLAALLPNGLFFAIDRASGEAVATAGALHNTRDGGPPIEGRRPGAGRFEIRSRSQAEPFG
jgi:hypothetical protein